MATVKFLHFDAFGIYVPGGPVDQIIDAFDEAKVVYRHHHLTGGVFEIGYLTTPRAAKIVDRVAKRYYAERVWRFREAQLKLLNKHFPEEAFEQLPEVLDSSHAGLCAHFDLPTQNCTHCGEPCPTPLVDNGRCPHCKELT
jgi:hypothetical protein